jgi:hypothetical protein
MTDPTGRNDERTAQEVREYLVTHLNGALRRPGMYGGEVAIRLCLNAVAYADAAEQTWQQELKDLQTRRGSSSTGVRGAFQDLWGDAHEGAVASVYAEIATVRDGCDSTGSSPRLSTTRSVASARPGAARTVSSATLSWRSARPRSISGGTTPTTPRR